MTVAKVRGVRGALAVPGALLFIAAAVIGGVRAVGGRPTPATIVDVVALDRDFAALVREVEDDPGRSFLSLFHRERGEVWGALIPRYSALPFPWSGLATTSGIITVRTTSFNGMEGLAFDAAAGHKLGRFSLVKQGGRDLPDIGTVAGLGMSYEFVAVAEPADGEPTPILVATDIIEGRERGRFPLQSSDIDSVWLQPEALFVYLVAEPDSGILHRFAMVADSARDERPRPLLASSLAVASTPCVSQDRVYVADGGDLRIYSGEFSEIASMTIAHLALRRNVLDTTAIGRAPNAQTPNGAAEMYIADCIAYAGGDVVLIQAGKASMAVYLPHRGQQSHDSRQALSAPDGADATNIDSAGTTGSRHDAGAQASWHLVLDGTIYATPQRSYARLEPAAAGATTPRFLPLLVGEPASMKLLMLDLERGTIAWQSQPVRDPGAVQLIAAQGRYYWWMAHGFDGRGAALLAMNGQDGALSAAIEMSGYAPVRPAHVADGAIWLYPDASQHPWVVVAGDTLERLGELTKSDDERHVAPRYGEGGPMKTIPLARLTSLGIGPKPEQ